jgi:hypothetical protein
MGDPTARALVESTNDLGGLASWRFAVVAFSRSRLVQIPKAIALDWRMFRLRSGSGAGGSVAQQVVSV